MRSVAVIGSRSFTDYIYLEAVLDTYNLRFSLITEIVSGGADGADSLAAKYAREHDIKCKIYKPYWDKYGKSAGFIRNTKIVERADSVIAFWDGESRGTKDSIDKTLEQKKNLFVFICKD